LKKILVPISFSKHSTIALQQAYSLAVQHNSILYLLHCCPAEHYNRPFDFGKQAYEDGIKNMLTDLFKQCSINNDKIDFQTIIAEGPVSHVLEKISISYNLIVMCRNVEKQSNTIVKLSDKLTYIISHSKCPVLLTHNYLQDFSFKNASKVWHIERKENEKEFIHSKLAKLGLTEKAITTKSIAQEKYSSSFWRNIINFSKSHNKSLLIKITESYKEEEIELIVFVMHQTNLFEQFIKNDIFSLLCQYQIPFIIFNKKKGE